MFLFPKKPTEAPELTYLLIHWIQWFIPLVKLPVREVKHLPPSSAEVKNWCS